MGNCSSPAAGPKVPEPKLSPEKLGLKGSEARAMDNFTGLQEAYATLKKKFSEDGNRAADQKTDDALHKSAWDEKDVQEKATKVAQDLDKKLGLTPKAKEEFNKQLEEMGDDNPDLKAKDLPGPAEKAYKKSKDEAVKKAVEKVTVTFLEQQLKAAALEGAKDEAK